MISLSCCSIQEALNFLGINQIITEAKHLASNGCKEIILLGQNVNAYDFDGLRLSNLILEIEKISGIERIRYTTSSKRYDK